MRRDIMMLMNLEIFSAKTEQELTDIVKRYGGDIQLHSIEQPPQSWNEFIVDVSSDVRISRPGRAEPATSIYVATFSTNILRIMCTIHNENLYVNGIQETER